MPVVSQAQRRFMYAAAEGRVPGVKPRVGAEFVQASKGLTGLPEHITKARQRLRRINARRP